MTQQSKRAASIIREEEAAGRLRSWSQNVHPGYHDVELIYASEKDAHDVAGTLAGLGVKIDFVRTNFEFGGSVTETKINFRVPTDGRSTEPDACPACKGSGHIQLNTCWHCDGEGTDPAP